MCTFRADLLAEYGALCKGRYKSEHLATKEAQKKHWPILLIGLLTEYRGL